MRARDNRSLGEFLFDELKSAVGDIRGRLLDEGWFGRRVSPPGGSRSIATDWNGPTVHGTGGPERSSFEEQWAPRERDPASAVAPHEMDIER